MLAEAGFRVLQGNDAGWFGDGRYILGNGKQLLRITRSRGEEFLDMAFTQSPVEEHWFDLAEVMVAFDAIAFEDVVDARAIPHDLDFKVSAYLKLYSAIDKEVTHNRARLEQRLTRVRQRAMEYAQQKYGRNAHN